MVKAVLWWLGSGTAMRHPSEEFDDFAPLAPPQIEVKKNDY
jgi:hypothetical protein